MVTRKTKNEEEIRAFGLELAAMAKPGMIIALVGDLGTGKTTLARYIAEGLGVSRSAQHIGARVPDVE